MKSLYDVIVIGGGVAGCSAALASRRNGKSVLLLEKLTVLGGLATTGHIAIYLPLDDGYGRQVIGGISEELLRLSSKYAFFGDDYTDWKTDNRRYECKFNGPAFSLALEERLLDEGVEIMYDSLFAGSEILDGHVKAVFVENKSGRSTVGCRMVVDASGDADLFFRANEGCVAGKNNLAIWNYCTSTVPDAFYQKRGGRDAFGIKLCSIGKIDTSLKSQNYDEPYYGDSGEGVNRFIIDGHARLLENMKANCDIVPVSLPGIAQIRTSRRIEGAYVLADKDANAHFVDNIGGTGDWRKAGPVYEIPYRTLYTKGLKNVLASGRCISTSGEAWEIIRCIPQAALTGQVAGQAVCLALDSEVSVQDVDVEMLRRSLSSNGVILDVNGK